MEHFGRDCALAEKYAEKVIEMEPGGDSFTEAGFVYMRCGKQKKLLKNGRLGFYRNPLIKNTKLHECMRIIV